MIIEPGKQEKKLSEYLEPEMKILLVFWHGLGDVIQFIPLFQKLQQLYPYTIFNIGIQKGLDQDIIFPEAVLLNDLDTLDQLGYDLVALIHFPVETDPSLTKAELCAKEELGIDYINEHYKLQYFPSKLVGIHFNLTSLPHLANPARDTAEKIWNEIILSGFIPIETHFQHIFHNPVNERFDFIDCSVRKCIPKVESLVSLIQRCGAFIGVVSGNFHVAMSTLPHNRICYLEKDIPVSRFTHENITSINIKNYKDGEVTKFLNTL